MTIDELRKKIDEKDEENRAINASGRENEIIVRVAKNKPEELIKYVALFYRNVFSLSKAYQSEFYAENAIIGKKISESVRKPVVSATIAVRVSAEERAVASTVFPVAVVTEFKNDEGIVKAVKNGLCGFAVLPCDEGDGFVSDTLEKIIENDLSIVGMIDCERNPDGETRKTCYAVLAAKPTIFAGADRAAVVLELKNTAGSLLLPVSRLAGAGLNVTQIKSFGCGRMKTLAFIEFECDVTQKETLNVIAELSGSSEKFRFLGAYKHTL